MQKSKKTLLGLLGLALVAALTVFAYFLPAEGAFAEGGTAGTDTLRVTVFDPTQSPSIKVDSPEAESVQVGSKVDVTITYENAAYVDFVLSYKDDDNNDVEVPLPRFEPDPEELDPTYGIASGTKTIPFDLKDYGLGSGSGYRHYTITARSGSPVGFDEDSVDYYRIPASVNQTGKEEGTNDPIVEVEIGEGVAKVELMPTDKEGHPLFDEPIVIEIEPDGDGNYNGGTRTVTLPFTSYGLETDDYDVVATSSTGTVNPDTGETEFNPITPPLEPVFPIIYTQPSAPNIPNTGKFATEKSVAVSTDIAITAVTAFAGAAIIAFIVLGRKKKDYRKNIRSRK
ncbi:hypothetical protein IKG20_03000 [Candidatus Saccharibacteria bacterium]|nr:hypothetical protein [Candidatus Saccharibacteria bacterium]